MGKSYRYFKKEVCDCLKNKFTENARVLDVGAGDGIYYDLLHDYFKEIEAVEVFDKNIKDYELRKKYSVVYNCNILDFDYEIYGFYDIIIFGDVLEHLTVEEAQRVLKNALEHCNDVLVAVPYEYEQGIEYGNIYEIHKQADLTPEIMQERYPELKLLIGNELYGYYVRKEE